MEGLGAVRNYRFLCTAAGAPKTVIPKSKIRRVAVAVGRLRVSSVSVPMAPTWACCACLSSNSCLLPLAPSCWASVLKNSGDSVLVLPDDRLRWCAWDGHSVWTAGIQRQWTSGRRLGFRQMAPALSWQQVELASIQVCHSRCRLPRLRSQRALRLRCRPAAAGHAASSGVGLSVSLWSRRSLRWMQSS